MTSVHNKTTKSVTAQYDRNNTNFSVLTLLLFGSSLMLRLLLSYICPGHETDISCFAAWSERIYSVGPAAFYSTEVFTDYPPGYMYLLYVIGALRNLLQLTFYSGMHLLLLKLPAVICDMVSAAVIFRETNSRYSEKHALLIGAAYLFNPAIILNSSVWGQVDAVYTLPLLLLCLYLIRGRFFPACICFGIGTLIKPQMLIFTPVLLVYLADSVFLHKYPVSKTLSDIGRALAAALGTILLALPFGLPKVVSQYTDTLASYPYATVNAYNFWSLFGLNWKSQDTLFLFLPVSTWGTVVILLIVFFTFMISLRMRQNTMKYPLMCCFLIFSMFAFSTRMHERYLFAGLILLLLCFIQQPRKGIFLCYSVFSILNFCNTAHVLFVYDPYNYNANAPMIFVVSAGMTFCILFFYHTIAAICKKPDVSDKTFALPRLFGLKKYIGPTAPKPSETKVSFTRTDLLLVVVITFLYSLFALRDLGYRQAPETVHRMSQGESITLEFEKEDFPASLSYYIAPAHGRSFVIKTQNAFDDSLQQLGNLELSTVFTWKTLSLTELFPGTAFSVPSHAEDENADNASDNSSKAPTKTLQLTLSSDAASILELVFIDNAGHHVMPVNSADYPTLFDENHYYPGHSSYRDSMYFDEIYHARTAYEFLHGLDTYETTHPPLGKILIALGVAIFGMNPFGWRIIGTLLGIAMLPIMYLFGKKITGNTACAAFSCFLFAFDFMHFAQTRIATIDVYAVFFILLMYYFMLQYCHMSFYDMDLKKTFLPLGACGITMGLGVASKWTCAYAGVGLAILFFGTLYRRYREYLWAIEQFTDRSSYQNRSAVSICKKFLPNTVRTILFCLVFFVAIPFCIYLLSYLPFVDGTDTGLVSRMLKNQEAMFSYHSTLEATHAYSSPWYQWPTMVRPVWYYSNIVTETAEAHIREGISAFGNPLVWWAGIPAFFHMLYLTAKKKNRTAVFLIIGYLVQYLPWFFVTRITFLYHYFPSVIFVVLMITHSLMQLKSRVSEKVFTACLIMYATAVFALFLLFYPVLSGQPVSTEYVSTWLRWFDTWVLVSG